MTDSLATYTYTYRYSPVDTSTGGIDVAHTEMSFVGMLQVNTVIENGKEAESAFIDALCAWLLRSEEGKHLWGMAKMFGQLDFRDLKEAGAFENPGFLAELHAVGIYINFARVFEIRGASVADNDDTMPVPIESSFERVQTAMASSLHDF